MSKMKSKVSIVIPAYNEEDHLAECLRAISRQKIKPYEVIVVDNNSTDATPLIAKQFKFVTLIHEKRQGVVNARTTGFNLASGDIIGRIDVDTRIPPDWTAELIRIFEDASVDAVSGVVGYYDLPFYRLGVKIDLVIRTWLTEHLKNRQFLYGANMAIRRSVWPAVQADLCAYHGIHEDFDLALHLQFLNRRVVFDKELLAAVSGRRFAAPLPNFWHYLKMSPQTYARHDQTAQIHMYPVIVLALVYYLPLNLLHRSYDPITGRLSLRQLITKGPTNRVDPTANVA